MERFNYYSEYYDLLYLEKNYSEEVEYLNKLIKLYGNNGIDLLDIGCGTGIHANYFQKLGYNVEGMDFSKSMIDVAKEKFNSKINFQVGDIRDFNLNKTYDIITSLFHVISYQISNEEILSAFSCINKHLNKNGIFIFDCWYGPGVINDPPQIRIKRMENSKIKITRIAEPEIDYHKSVVDVNFEILIKKNGITDNFIILNEQHKMRYYFENEIELFAKNCGLKLLNVSSWLKNTKPTDNDWYATFILMK